MAKDDEEDELNEDGVPLWKEKAMEAAKAKRQKFPALNRPIILVCNDGYARPLFPMKDIVLKMRIMAASNERINERLIEILRNEGIKDLSNSVRLRVVDQSNGDARSAITRVQMIATNRRAYGSSAQETMAAQAEMANLQHKDMSQSIFELHDFILGGNSQDLDKKPAGSLYKEISEKANAFGDSQ